MADGRFPPSPRRWGAAQHLGLLVVLLLLTAAPSQAQFSPPAQPASPLNAVQAATLSSPISIGMLHGCGVVRTTATAFCWGLPGPYSGMDFGDLTPNSNPLEDSNSNSLAICAGDSTSTSLTNWGLKWCNQGSCKWGSQSANGKYLGIGGSQGSEFVHNTKNQFIVGLSVASSGWSSENNWCGFGCMSTSTPASPGDTYLGYSLGLLSTGVAKGWGNCASGACGIASTSTSVTSPSSASITVNTSSFRVLQLTAGPTHSCFLLNSGAVVCSGSGASGEQGSGILGSPTSQPNMGATIPTITHPAPYYSTWPVRVASVTAGYRFTCFLYNTGFVTCSGTNAVGQCGNPGNANPVPSPALFVLLPIVTSGAPNPTIQISAGRDFACALNLNGSVYCWGSNANNQISSAGNPSFSTPQLMPLAAGLVGVQVACGWKHLCILRNDSKVVCSGDNTFGQVTGSASVNVALTAASSPVFSAITTPVLALSAGSSASGQCVLTNARGFREWNCQGNNYVVGFPDGVGVGTAPAPAAPASGTPLTTKFIQMTQTSGNPTADSGSDWTPTPIVLSIAAAPAAFLPDSTWSSILLNVWAPYNFSNPSRGLRPVAYIGGTACTSTFVTSPTTVVCGLNYASVASVASLMAPFPVSFSWNGGPANAVAAVQACPRVVLQQTSLPTLSTLGGQFFIVTGLCITSNWRPSALAAITIPPFSSGRLTLSVNVINNTAFSFTMPPGAGTGTISVNSPLAVHPAATISYAYGVPTLGAAQTSKGQNYVLGAGETILVTGTNFAPLGMGFSTSALLDGAIACTVTPINNTAVFVVIPGNIPPASLNPQLSIIVEGQVSSNTIQLTYQGQITSVVPSSSYANTGYASARFTVYGAVMGTTTALIAAVNIGGANCSSFTLINSTAISCLFTPLAMASMVGRNVFVLPVSGPPIFTSGIFTPYGLPTITSVVNKANDGLSVIFIDGSSLGYGHTLQTVVAGPGAGSNAPVIGEVGLWAPATGERQACASKYFLAGSLGSGIFCVPPAAALAPGLAYTPYVSLESNITVLPPSPPSLLFSNNPPRVSSVSTLRGGNVVSANGETVAVFGSYFGYTGTTLVGTVLVNGASVAFSRLSDSSIAVVVPQSSGLVAVNLTVGVLGQFSAPATLSYETPTISSVSPASYYSVTGRLNKTFIISGSGFGLSNQNVSSATVGGATCSPALWISPFSISCFIPAASIGALTVSTVSVSLVGGTSGAASVFTPLGVPTISRIVTEVPNVYTAPIMIIGQSLGYGPVISASVTSTSALTNAPVIESVSLQDFSPNRTVTPCSTTTYGAVGTPLGAGMACMPPVTVASSVPYAVRVLLEDGIVVYAPTNVSYSSTAPQLSVSWATTDLAPIAQASTSGAIFPFAPAPALTVTTSAGSTPVNPITCMLILSTSPANLPPSSTIYALLTGNTSTNVIGTSATFYPLGIIGQSGWNYTLSAQCAYFGIAPWFATNIPASVRVQVLPFFAAWTVAPSNGSVISGAASVALGPLGLLAPLRPPPTVVLFVANGPSTALANFVSPALGSTTPVVSCSVAVNSLSAAPMSAMGTLLAGMFSTNASCPFSSMGIVGALGFGYSLSATCTWPTGETISVVSASSTLITLAATWATAPPTTFLYNTPTATASVLINQLDATSGLWIPFTNPSTSAADFFCTLAMTAAGTTVPLSFIGGTIGAFVPASGTMSVSAMSLLPSYSGTVGAVTSSISLTCSFRAQSLPALLASTTMSNLSVTWTATPPIGVTTTSASKTINGPSLSIALRDANTLALQSSDSTTTCALSVLNAFSRTGGAALATLSGSLSLQLASGVGAFSAWQLSAQLQTVVTLDITCTRAEGGPSSSIVTNVTINGAEAFWSDTGSINATFSGSATNNSLVLFDKVFNVTARIMVRNASAISDPNAYNYVPFVATALPSASCSLSVDASAPAAANAALGGSSSIYQSVAVGADGTVVFPVRLQATPGILVPLALACSYGDTSVTPPLLAFATVANVVAAWGTTNTFPPFFIFNNATAPFALDLWAVMPQGVAAPFLAPLAMVASDVSCSITASSSLASPALNDIPFQGGVAGAFLPASSSVPFSGVTLTPLNPFGGLIVVIQAVCTLRSSLVLAPLDISTVEVTLSLNWIVPPPTTFTASSSDRTFYLPSASLSLLDQNGDILATDSTTVCQLSMQAFTNASVTINTAVLLGNTIATLESGNVTFRDWAIQTPMDSFVQLAVTCNRIQGGPAITNSWNLAASGGSISWANVTTVFPDYTAAGGTPTVLFDVPFVATVQLVPHLPYSDVQPSSVYDTFYNASLFPSASCGVFVDISAPIVAGAYLSGDPTAYQGQMTDAYGVLTLSLRLSSAPEVPIPIVLSCSYGDATIATGLLYVQVAALSLAWATPPPSLFVFNTLTAPSSFYLQAHVPNASATTFVNASMLGVATADLSCSSEVYDATSLYVNLDPVTVTVPYTGGAPGALDNSTSLSVVEGFQISPATQSSGYVAVMAVACSYRQFMSVAPVFFSSALMNLYLDWNPPPPVSWMPSSSSQVFGLPPVSLLLYDENIPPALLSADSTSSCTLSVSRATDVTGAITLTSAATVGDVQATASGGSVNFANWGIQAPFGAIVELLASCTRIERGPPLSATWSIAMDIAQVQWLSVGGISAPGGARFPTVITATPFSVTALVSFFAPTGANVDAPSVPLAFNASSAPTTTCSAFLPQQAGVQSGTLSGDDAQYISVAPNASGYVSLTFALAAGFSDVPVDVAVQCVMGDIIVNSNATEIVVASIAAAFPAAPPLPTTFPFGEALSTVGVQLYANVIAPGGGSSLTLLPVPLAAPIGDVQCAVSATSAATGTSLTVSGTASASFSPFFATNSSIYLSGIAPAPTYAGVVGGVDCTIAISCTYRGLAAPPISFTPFLQNYSIVWSVAPPVSSIGTPNLLTATGQLQASVSPIYLAPFSVSMFYQDNVTPLLYAGTVCTLSASRAPNDLTSNIVLGGQLSADLVNGSATFNASYLIAPFRVAVLLQVTCTPGNGGPPASSPIAKTWMVGYYVSVASAAGLNAPSGRDASGRLVGSGLPAKSQLLWYYGSAYPITVQLYANTTLDASGRTHATSPAGALPILNNITCSLALQPGVDFGASTSLGGDASAYFGVNFNASGYAMFAASLNAPPYIPVTLQVSCATIDSTTLPFVYVTANVSGLRLLPTAYFTWPSFSSAGSTAVLAPSLSLFLANDLGNAGTDDNASATCTLSVASTALIAADGSQWNQLPTPAALSFSVLQATGDYAVNPFVTSGAIGPDGVVSFENVKVANDNLAGILASFTATCTRTAGSAFVIGTTVRTISFAALTVQWLALPAAQILYNTPVTASVSFNIQSGTAIGAGGQTVPTYTPFNASASPSAAVCTITIATSTPGAATISLSGAVQATVDDMGMASFSFSLGGLMSASNPPNELTVQCVYAGSTIAVGATALVQILSLQAHYTSLPPTLVWPSSSTAVTVVRPSPSVLMTDAAGASAPTTGVSCGVNANGNTPFWRNVTAGVGAQYASMWMPVVVSAPQNGYQFDPTTQSLSLNKVAVQAWWGSPIELNLKCTRPEGDAIPVLTSWVINTPFVSLVWETLPQTSIRFATPINMSFGIIGQDSSPGSASVPTLALQDSTTICTVCADERVASLPPGTPQAVPCNANLYKGQQGVGGTTMSSNVMTAAFGLVSFTVLQLSGRVGTSYDINVTCQYGDIPYPMTLASTLSIDLCLLGEAPTADLTACLTCGSGSYSDGGLSPCILCPDGTTCSNGLIAIQTGYYLALTPDAQANPSAYNITVIVPGRYRPTIGPSTELHPCWTPESCDVNATERSYACAVGHKGVLCGVCDIDQGYVAQGTKCIQCLHPGLDVFLLVIISLLLLLGLTFISLVMDFGNPSEAKTVWRILINYLSAISAFSTYVAQGTSAFLSSFSILQSILVPGAGGGMDLSPVQCEIAPGFYTRFSATIMLPVICGTICVIINLVNLMRLHGCGANFRLEATAFFTSNKAIAVVTLILFMAYPALTAKAFTMFQCMPVAIAGVHYLKLDLAVSCDTTTHALFSVLAWAVIGTLSAGLPMVFIWFLTRNEKKVQLGMNSPFFGTFGFLYQGYKTDKWYYYSWEAFVMIRKAFIVAIAATTKDPIYQCTCAILLLSTCLGMQLHVAPFHNGHLNYLESLALVTLVFTMCISLMFLRSAQITTGELATFTPPANSPGGQAAVIESGAMLNETSTSTLLILINLFTLITLIYTFISIKRAELMAQTTCVECCQDIFDCKKARKERSFVFKEISARLLPGGGAGGAAAAAAAAPGAEGTSAIARIRRSLAAKKLDERARLNPIATAPIQATLKKLATAATKEVAAASAMPKHPIRLSIVNRGAGAVRAKFAPIAGSGGSGGDNHSRDSFFDNPLKGGPSPLPKMTATRASNSGAVSAVPKKPLVQAGGESSSYGREETFEGTNPLAAAKT